MLVPKQMTPRTRIEIAGDLRSGHVVAFGGPPCLTRWAGIVAHNCLEHGNGAKLFNLDYGNVTASADWKRNPANDWIDMLVPPPDPPKLSFRSFNAAPAGANSYLRVMSGRYVAALQCWDRGDYAGGVNALKAKGYMTAKLEPYRDAVVSIAQWAATKLLPGLIVEEERPAFVCDAPDCDGELRSFLTDAMISEILAEGAVVAWNLAGDAIADMRADARRTIPD
jgi:hypothetical protein